MSVIVHPTIVSVGASGAIFGLFGVFLALAAPGDARTRESRNLILINAGIFIALNLFLDQVSIGIDNAAHMGGLACGLVLG